MNVRFRIFSIICVAGLVFLGFNQAAAQKSLSRLRQSPLNLNVPVIMQSSGTSCGEAVIAMTHNYAYPQAPISEAEVITYAQENGYYTADLAPYTSPRNMVNIAEHYAQEYSTGEVKNANRGLALLIQKLRSDEPVIIDVLSNFNDPDSEAHFVVVSGISMDASRADAIVIHYNDPLTGTNESADWSGSDGVWNAWQHNGDPGGSGWWLVISPA